MNRGLTTVRVILDNGTTVLIQDALAVTTDSSTRTLWDRNYITIKRPGGWLYYTNVAKVLIGRNK